MISVPRPAIVAISIAAVALGIYAAPVSSAKADAICPLPEKLYPVCLAITNVQRDTTGKHQYHYQKLIYDAACSGPEDDDGDTGNVRIQRMWKDNADRLVCNNSGFDVQSGSVLKYAVSSRFEDFLFDAAMVWKVDLNRVDASDGRTLLDYTRDEIGRNKGHSIETTLRAYYDMLRSSGAKHKHELPGE